MNKVIEIGRLVSEPELKTTTTGKSVCELRIAVSQRDREQSYYFTVVAWGTLAEHCSRYLVKGQRLAVIGELQSRSYEAKDGSKRYVTEIKADEIEFLDKPKAQQGEAVQEASPGTSFGDGWEEVDDDDLPFG